MRMEALEDLLRVWGRVYGERAHVEAHESERAADVHPLAVAMRFAPGSRSAVVKQHTFRGGQERRRLMAAGLGDCGVAMVSMSFVDPVPGSRSSNSGGGGREQAVDTVVAAVQAAWLTLHRFDTQRAAIVQAEYQRRGMTQGDKAAMLGVKLKRYRDDLVSGKVWLHGRLAG